MKMIRYAAKVDKSLSKMPRSEVEKIEAKIERYALSGEGDVKALKASQSFRLRAGNYRVIFTEDFEIIDIEDVGHRREIYL